MSRSCVRRLERSWLGGSFGCRRRYPADKEPSVFKSMPSACRISLTFPPGTPTSRPTSRIYVVVCSGVPLDSQVDFDVGASHGPRRGNRRKLRSNNVMVFRHLRYLQSFPVDCGWPRWRAIGGPDPGLLRMSSRNSKFCPGSPGPKSGASRVQLIGQPALLWIKTTLFHTFKSREDIVVTLPRGPHMLLRDPIH